MNYINHNGQLIAEELAPPTLENSVFRFENGLFESMLVIEDEIQLKDLHFARLKRGIDLLGLGTSRTYDDDFWEAEILKTINSKEEGNLFRIRLQVYKESAYRPNLYFTIDAIPIDAAVFSLNEIGWKLGLLNTDLKPFNQMGNLKAIHPEFYRTNTNMAIENNWEDVLIVHNNHIVETGTANIFWIKNETIFTTPLSEGCISGVMRKFLLMKLQEKYRVEERTLTKDVLFDADEVFLTNAIRRIKWVEQIEDHSFTHHLTGEIHKSIFG